MLTSVTLSISVEVRRCCSFETKNVNEVPAEVLADQSTTQEGAVAELFRLQEKVEKYVSENFSLQSPRRLLGRIQRVRQGLAGKTPLLLDPKIHSEIVKIIGSFL